MAVWRCVVNSIREEAQNLLNANEYVEIRCEDFTTDAMACMTGVWQSLCLSHAGCDIQWLRAFHVLPGHDAKWRSDLSRDDQHQISR